MNVEIIIEDNSKIALAEFEKKKIEMLNGCGTELYKAIYNQMTVDQVVDTGRLRGSISYSTPYEDYSNPTMVNKENDFITGVREENTVVYGSNVEYANYVETGTSKQRARNFLQIGTQNAILKCREVVEKVLKGD